MCASLPGPSLGTRLAIEQVGNVSRAPYSISKSGEKGVAVACEAAKAVLIRAFDDLLSRNQGAPLLTSKSCDGTPINAVDRAQVKLPSGKVVHCSGRAAHEFLVKVQWLRAIRADGSHETIVLLQAAQPLIYGKK
eukprot:1909561-Lingulodinium_polyedra.AAC.1